MRSGRATSCGCRINILSKEREEFIGKKYGMLTAISYDGSKKEKTFWNFLCDCGNKVIKNKADVVSGKIKSCGCKTLFFNSEAHIKREEKGTVYNYLEILEDNYSFLKDNNAYWKCKCLLCGNIVEVSGCDLRSGNVKTCGNHFSIQEERIAEILKKCGYNFERQYSFSDLKGRKNLLRFDFAIHKNNSIYLIEYQGEQHFLEIPRGYFTEESIKTIKEYDLKKKEYCEERGIPLLYLNKSSNLEKEILNFLEV